MEANRAHSRMISHDDFMQKRNEFQLLRHKAKKLQYVPLKLVNFDHRYLINEKT